MQYLPIFIPTLAGVMLCTVLVIFLVKNMPKPLRDLFSMLVICALAWLLAYIGELLIPNATLKYVSVSIKYLFIPLVPVCILLLVKHFFGENRIMRARSVAALLLVPVSMMLLCWTNPWHYAFFQSVESVPVGQLYVLQFIYGPLFYVCLACEFMLLFWSLAVVLRAMTNTHRAYMRMCVLLLLCICIPVICLSIHVFLDPFQGMDITPLSLAVSIFLLAWVVNDAKLMEFFPLGRSQVFQRMDIPMMYIDGHGYVADVNTAAARFFGRYESQLLYRSANDVCKSCLHLDLETWERDTQEIRLQRDEMDYTYLVRRTWLYDGGERLRAQLLFFFDISEIKNRQESAQYLANYDMVTGLPNRNLFAKLLQRDIDSTLRYGETLVLFAVEVCNLQQINTSNGFRAGEALLAKTGEVLVNNLRRIDTVAHIEAGQFYIILPKILSRKGLQLILNRLMSAFRQPVEVGEASLPVTLHIGITFMPQDAASMDDLVSNAGVALQMIAQSPQSRYEFFSHAWIGDGEEEE